MILIERKGQTSQLRQNLTKKSKARIQYFSSLVLLVYFFGSMVLSDTLYTELLYLAGLWVVCERFKIFQIKKLSNKYPKYLKANRFWKNQSPSNFLSIDWNISNSASWLCPSSSKCWENRMAEMFSMRIFLPIKGPRHSGHSLTKVAKYR